MRKLLVMLVALLLVTAAVVDPGNGSGKGTCKQNNKQCLKWCGEPPALRRSCCIRCGSGVW